MLALPDAIKDFILSLTDDRLSPGFMLIDEQNRLGAYGGDLELYGVENLEIGTDVSERVPFLSGTLPLGSSSVFLPHMQTKPGVFADIYLFTRDEGIWVLLLDATAEATGRQRIQQKLYDSRLEIADLQREGDALYNTNAVLEELVRERTAELMQTILQLRQQLATSERPTRNLKDRE